MKLDDAAVLAEFDEQVRRGTQSDGSGSMAERAGPVVRWTAVGGPGWSGIAWSDLDIETADEIIADQVRFFQGRGERFEWKLYSYDRPADLGQRLLAAGFVREDEESLMIAEVAGLRADAVAAVTALFASEGAAAYLGEPVSQAAHMLQAAALAEQDQAAKAIVTAALLHDVGHFGGALNDHDLMRGGSAIRHEENGAAWLAQWFCEEVCSGHWPASFRNGATRPGPAGAGRSAPLRDPTPAQLVGPPPGDGRVPADHLDLAEMVAEAVDGLLRLDHRTGRGRLRDLLLGSGPLY
jgi:hypothetical protein